MQEIDRALDPSVLEQIKSLESDCRKILRGINARRVDYIINRWEIGRLVYSQTGDRQPLGSNIMERLAAKSGIHIRILYDCKNLYVTFDTKNVLRAWMEEVIQRNGTVIWTDVQSRLSTRQWSKAAKLKLRAATIERQAEKLDQATTNLLEQLEEAKVNNELADTVAGVATAAVDTIQYAQQATSVIADVKKSVSRSEVFKNFIRSQPCAACGQPSPSEPHHVEQRGKAQTGSDYSCVPLCHECHRLTEDKGHIWMEQQAMISFAVVIAKMLHRYLTLLLEGEEKDLELPRAVQPWGTTQLLIDAVS